MRTNKAVYNMTVAALLCAVGIVIPMFSPFKIVFPTMSFTLASHVAIFIAMFISPFTAVAVSLGTTIGFFFGGFPILVVFRAASHLIFSTCGAFVIMKSPKVIEKRLLALAFSFCVALVHAICEVFVVMSFYFSGSGTYEGSLVSVVLIPVGLGTLVHSMVDFEISLLIWKPLRKVMKRPV